MRNHAQILPTAKLILLHIPTPQLLRLITRPKSIPISPLPQRMRNHRQTLPMPRPARIRNRRISRPMELQNRHLTASRVTLDLHGAGVTGVLFGGKVLVVSAGDGGEGGDAGGGNGVAG